MMIQISKCRHYDAMLRWEEERGSWYTLESDGRIIFEVAPECAGCGMGEEYAKNSGLPCSVGFDPFGYKNGKYKYRPDLATRKICRRIARLRRRAEWLRKYRIRQDFYRILRKYLKNEQEEGTK